MKRLLNIAYLIFGVAIGVLIGQSFADVRLEAAAGQCRHELGPDTSWYYQLGGFRTDMNMKPNCGQLGFLWEIDKTFGIRASFVDLGHIRADNEYPLPEAAYFVAKATHTAINAGTYRYQGNGGSRGFSLGPVVQKDALGMTFSAETGLAYLYNYWHAWTSTAGTWDYADGWKWSPYFGVGVRWKILTASVRYYTGARASQSKNDPLFVGPTNGRVMQMMLGVSVRL